MPVEFRFARLGIRNFRGIRELELDLPEGMPVHLIGGNNSGKSTTLDAMALALRGGGMHAFTPEPFDFFHDAAGTPTTDFTITLRFGASNDKNLPAVQGMGNPIPVHGIRVLGSADKHGQFRHQHVLIGSDDKTITFSQRTPLKGDAKETFAGQGLGWRPVNARPDDIRDHLPDVWLLRPDNLRASLYHWKTGPLQRLSRMLADKFLHADWTLDFDGKPRKMPQTLVSAHGFFRDAVTRFPFWADELKPRLQETLSMYVGREAKMDLRPDIRALEDWLSQQLAVSFATDAGGTITPLERMGDGWQSLVRIATLDVLTQFPDQVRERVVLLFEEPETYLHPHLTRKLRGVRERLAASGWTVLTATHAPEMISFASPQVVVRLWRKPDGVGKGELRTTEAGSHAKFQERLDERGGHEMLFAQRALLCEGKDDVFAIRLYLEKLKIDLDGRSVSIINAGDVGAIPAYAEMAKKLGIPWCAITDEDKEGDGSIKKNTEISRRKLDEIKTPGDRSLVWKGDLEACLGKKNGKADPEWIARELDARSANELQRNYPDYDSVVQEVVAWLNQKPTSA
jgi:energy-coupling factor transporter ATP-binding protein EcfA2